MQRDYTLTPLVKKELEKLQRTPGYAAKDYIKGDRTCPEVGCFACEYKKCTILINTCIEQRRGSCSFYKTKSEAIRG